LEGGLRVPQIVWWPGHIRAGDITDQVCITMDLTATCLAAANVMPDAAHPLDGRDLLPVLTGEAPPSERTLYWRMANRSQRAVRRGDWKYLKVRDTEYLFDWLRELYPTWAAIDADWERTAAEVGLAELALSGCSTTTDHHYVFPAGVIGLLEAEIDVAAQLGIRFQPCRGSMDLGQSRGGLPPDSVVEDIDTVLDATERAIQRFHDPAPGSMLRIAVGPCSPFSVSPELMRESAALARKRQVRLHTHIAETLDEEAYCLKTFNRRPLELLEDFGFLGPDVWLAHCVHLSSADIHRMAESRTGVAWCPTSNMRLGSGFAPAREMIDAGVSVGIAVDGSASNDSGNLLAEVRQALLTTRARKGAASMTAREALRVSVLRLLTASVKNREIELGHPLTDEEFQEVARREVKRRREAIEAYEAAGREDRAAQEREEQAVLETYLPAGLSDAEVDVLIEQAIAETGASAPSDLGKVMGLVMGRAKGRTDGRAVQERVRRRLGS